MDIPPFWIRESREIAGMVFKLCGRSYRSMAEARGRLEARAALFSRFYTPPPSDDVEGLRSSLRGLRAEECGDDYVVDILEPVVERVDSQNVITRNRAGAEVLNTSSLCVVDIDSFPDPSPVFKKLLAAICVSKYDRRAACESALGAALDRLCREQADLGARLYRTAGGWRVILQGEGLAYDSSRMLALSGLLHADPLYVSLCRKQQCWRARLTPKWRRLKSRHPGLGAFPSRRFSDTPADGEAAWLAAYAQACQGVAVCRLVECFGRAVDSPILALHDTRTLALRPDHQLA